MRIYLLLLIVLIGLPAAAQTGTGQIAGKVKEAVSGEPVDFAVIGLTSASGFRKSAMSDNGGAFSFTGLPDDIYQVTVSFIGFLPDTVKNLRPALTEPVRPLVISLRKNSRVLEEVTISDSRELVEYDADRITYNADQTLLSEGSVATDLLRNVPMVDVDPDGKPSIAGKQNTRIFINGKPSDYTAAGITDLLNVLPSDAILKIEVISSPPAKYSADGDGIINIELKKDFRPGLTGSLGGTGTSRGNYNGNGMVNYYTGNLKISSNAALRRNNRQTSGTSFRENFTSDTTHYLIQNQAGLARSQGRNLRSTLDWDLSPQQNLRVSLNLNGNSTDGANESGYEYRDAELRTQRLRKQHSEREGHSSGQVVDADYIIRFTRNKEEKLAFGVNYARTGSAAERFSERGFLRPDGSPDPAGTTIQYQENETLNRNLDFTLDYDRPFKTEGRSLEAGLRLTHKLADHIQMTGASGAEDLSDPTGTPFRFHETLYAAYAAIRTRTRQNLGLRAGLRTELTDAAISGSASGPYINLFPSVAVSRSFSKKFHAGLSYGMRVNRPRANALNPQVENSDPVNISYGNPDLKPAITHQVDLSLGTFREKWSLSSRTGYSDTRKIIERVRSVGDDGISRSTYQNMSGSRSYSLHLSGTYRPAKTVRSTAGFSITRRRYDTENSILIKRNGVSVRSNIGVSVQLPKRLALESDIRFSSNSSAQGTNRGSVGSSFSARKSVWNNRLSVRVSAVDPFYRQNTAENSEGINFRLRRTSETATGSFGVALSYRFMQSGKHSGQK